ncbi:MAG: hypothetical protein QNJ14_04255 [Woeseiaceae bacterium]|nr:hypothetical protein [Woeseiaceae bacterium]
MSARTFTLLDGVTANTTGATTNLLLARNKHIVQVIAADSPNASCLIEGSLDGSNWNTLATKTGGEVFEVLGVPYIRARVTGYVAGTWTVLLQQGVS